MPIAMHLLALLAGTLGFTQQSWVDDCFARMGLAENPPEIRIVETPHQHLSQGERARAVLFMSGREVIYMDEGLLRFESEFRETLDHEAAHIAAWREYGPDIETHGREWRRVCRSRAMARTHCSHDMDTDLTRRRRR